MSTSLWGANHTFELDEHHEMPLGHLLYEWARCLWQLGKLF